jgi:Tubulin/FtsZ family, GTPase domain
VAIYKDGEEANEPILVPDPSVLEEAWANQLRLGQDVRFVLVAVGGGGIRVAREIARRHIRHLETVAINCDPKVQSFDEFDRRVYLGPDSGVEGDTGGSPFVGGLLARAAEPALDRIFTGATFVIVVGSLGGGAGSGALPYLLEVASRHAEVVSAFVIRPFRCEGERRALADRAIGRLHFVEAFVEKRERGLASLRTLDNESLVTSQATLAFRQVAHHWADLIQDHIESAFLAPTEALLEAAALAHSARLVPMNELTEAELPTVTIGTPPLAPPAPPEFPPLLPAASGNGGEVELTFEIVPEVRAPGAR